MKFRFEAAGRPPIGSARPAPKPIVAGDESEYEPTSFFR